MNFGALIADCSEESDGFGSSGMGSNEVVSGLGSEGSGLRSVFACLAASTRRAAASGSNLSAISARALSPWLVSGSGDSVSVDGLSCSDMGLLWLIL